MKLTVWRFQKDESSQSQYSSCLKTVGFKNRDINVEEGKDLNSKVDLILIIYHFTQDSVACKRIGLELEREVMICNHCSCFSARTIYMLGIRRCLQSL